MKKTFLLLATCFVLSLVPAMAQAQPITQMAFGSMIDGRTQVWALDNQGGLWTMWQQSTDPNAGWTQWSSYPTPCTGLSQIYTSQLSDGRPEVSAIDGQGNLWSMWKQTTAPSADYTQWSQFQGPGAAANQGTSSPNVQLQPPVQNTDLYPSPIKTSYGGLGDMGTNNFPSTTSSSHSGDPNFPPDSMTSSSQTSTSQLIGGMH